MGIRHNSLCKLKKQVRNELSKQIQLFAKETKLLPNESTEKKLPVLKKDKPALVFQLQEFMNRFYEFRQNELTCEVEYRKKNSAPVTFCPLYERDLNSIILKAQEEGIAVWDRDVKRFIHSNRIAVYNPVDEYMKGLPAWDGKERIRELADQVPSDSREWRDRFYIWFLSMVAHWKGMDMQHGNCSLPLLIGEQGCGKSTWCLNLLPPCLREFYTDSINLGQRSEAEHYLGRFLLINIDEFDSVRNSYQSFLKHILQKPVVQLRRPYQIAIRQMKRYASFVGTCNQFDLLTDSSGNRRYLCVEVTGQIHHDLPIEYEQLYAEALHALSSGQRYWFTHEEEMEISRQNSKFQQLPPAEQLFLRYFRPALKEEGAERLQAVEILQRIQKRTSVKLSSTTITSFGRLLHRHNVPKIHTEKGNFYWVAEVK